MHYETTRSLTVRTRMPSLWSDAARISLFFSHNMATRPSTFSIAIVCLSKTWTPSSWMQEAADV